MNIIKAVGDSLAETNRRIFGTDSVQGSAVLYADDEYREFIEERRRRLAFWATLDAAHKSRWNDRVQELREARGAYTNVSMDSPAFGEFLAEIAREIVEAVP
jgi:hypothetical protein